MTVFGHSLMFCLRAVLKAMAEGSSSVPRLMSEYLQSECESWHTVHGYIHTPHTVLTSPVNDRHHSFKEDVLSPSQSNVLSTLSV